MLFPFLINRRSIFNKWVGLDLAASLSNRDAGVGVRRARAVLRSRTPPEGDHCGDHGRFWARSRSLARIMQLVASRTRRSLAEPGFGFWPFHSNHPRGRRSPTPRLAFAHANAAPPARALWTARIKSPSCRQEVGLRNQLLRHGLGAVRCIGVDVLAYSPPPAAML